MTDTLATVTATAGGDPGLGRSGAAWTVRDATFEVMRRFGMTTIFGNPGSTEVSFLTDLPADIEFVLALHEGSAVGIASGYAIARGRTVVRQPPYGSRARQRGQRDRQRARHPRPTGRRRRPAGPPADRVRAVPDRPRARPARRRIPRVGANADPRPGRPGHDRARVPRGEGGRRPRARGRADERLGAARRRARGERAGARRQGHVDLVDRAPRARRARRTGRAPRDRRRRGLRQPRGVGRAGGAGRAPATAPCGRSRSARAPGSRRTTRCSPGTCTGAGG